MKVEEQECGMLGAEVFEELEQGEARQGRLSPPQNSPPHSLLMLIIDIE